MTEQECNEALLSNQILDKLGLQPKKILAEAADRLGCEIDVSSIGAQKKMWDMSLLSLEKSFSIQAEASTRSTVTKLDSWISEKIT